MKKNLNFIAVGLVVFSTFNVAAVEPSKNDSESSGLEAVSMEAAVDTLQSTVLAILRDFIAHTPYLIAGLFVLIITGLFASVFGRIVLNITSKSKLRNSLRDLLARITRISVWMFGFLLAAMVVFPGLTPSKALGGLGLASIAIGFAFKEIFENFFAGILLLWKYPFETGDFIECEDIVGKVEDISVRMTQIRKTNGELVLVPNSFLFKNPVYVLTEKEIRRITIMTGVAYSEDADDAVSVIEKAVQNCETVISDQPVQVFLHGFGASSIDIEVTWWTQATPLGQRRSRSEVVSAIKRALDNAGIEIPFPYRTLTFKQPLEVLKVD